MNNKQDINKTKYRYFKDNFSLFPVQTTIKYIVPEDKNPNIIDGHLNRNYHSVNISNIKFSKMVEKVANSLISMGIKEGDFVTICQSNTPETYYMDYALSKIGAIPNYVYPNVTKEELRKYFEEVNSKLIFILDEPDIRKKVIDATDGIETLILTSTAIESFPEMFKKIANKKSNNIEKQISGKILNWSDFIKLGKKENAKEVSYKKDSICSLVRTSGTSSTPKAVMDSNENINAVVRNYEKDGITYKKGNMLLQTIPIFVSYGKSTSHVMMCNNVGLMLIPEMNPMNFADLILKYKPDYAFATPSHGEKLVNDSRVKDLSFLKIIGLGGDGFDSLEGRLNSFLNQHKALNQLNNPTFACNGYGSSEVEAVAISNSEVYHKEGTLGKPVGDTVAQIFDVDTQMEVEDGVVGELAITGPTVTLGYYNDPEETKKVYKKHNDGRIWVHMGDLAYKDEDGFYHYGGRIKNVIARKSFKFSPKEIVDAILLHPNVEDCVVIGKYSFEEGQVPSAHITLKDYSNMDKTLREIINLVNENVQEFHRPTTYKIREYMVKTRNNKNNFNALRIEDIATLYPGVVDSRIELLTDENYDYRLNITFSGMVDNNLENDIIKFINELLEKDKVPKCKVKYNIKGVTYTDSESYYKENSCKTYVKEV